MNIHKVLFYTLLLQKITRQAYFFKEDYFTCDIVLEFRK